MSEQEYHSHHAQYNTDNAHLPSTPHYIFVQGHNDSMTQLQGIYEQPILRHIPSSPPPPYSSPAPNTYNPAYSGPEPQVYDPTQPIMPVFRAPREQELPTHLFHANTRRNASSERTVEVSKHQVYDAYKRAIIACICCFIPLGVIAVWHATKAKDASKEDYSKIEKSVRDSLKYSKLSCQVGTILMIVYFILIVIIAKQFT